MGDLFEGYGAVATQRRGAAPWDEMFASADTARGAYREIHAALARMTQEELRGRTESLANSYLAQGVPFDFAREERPLPAGCGTPRHRPGRLDQRRGGRQAAREGARGVPLRRLRNPARGTRRRD